MTPHPCVILAIDPGRKAGWCIRINGKPAVWGSCSPGEEFGIVRAAVVYAEDAGIPLVVVAEKWTAGGKHMTPSMVAGLGAAWGRWDGAIRAVQLPRRRVVRVYPQTWQAAVLRPKFGSKSETLKHLSMTVASFDTGEVVDDDNAADAVCMSRWAAMAKVVADALPKRRAKRVA